MKKQLKVILFFSFFSCLTLEIGLTLRVSPIGADEEVKKGGRSAQSINAN